MFEIAALLLAIPAFSQTRKKSRIPEIGICLWEKSDTFRFEIQENGDEIFTKYFQRFIVFLSSFRQFNEWANDSSDQELRLDSEWCTREVNISLITSQTRE